MPAVNSPCQRSGRQRDDLPRRAGIWARSNHLLRVDKFQHGDFRGAIESDR